MTRERVVPVVAILLFIALAALTLGCEQLGLVKPETVNQKLAYSYASVTQIRQTAARMLQAKQLSVDDARHVLAITDLSRASLDRAKAIAQQGDQPKALKEIQFADGLIKEIQVYLKSKEAT